jgi:hypothetical protein
MQPKEWLDARIKVEQLPDRDLRFPRIISPARDCVGNVIIQIEQTIFGRCQRRQIPKRFCSAVYLVRRLRVLLQQRSPILNREKRNAAMPRRIFRRRFYCGLIEGRHRARATRERKQ